MEDESAPWGHHALRGSMQHYYGCYLVCNINMRDNMFEHWNLHDIEVEASEEVMEDSYEEMVAEPVTSELNHQRCYYDDKLVSENPPVSDSDPLHEVIPCKF